MKTSLEVTREFQRVGALQGRILDANGEVIYDLYKKFCVTQKKIMAPLDVETTSESKLTGVLMTGFKAFCGSAWFDQFTAHPSVEKAYANYQEATDRLGGDMRKGFRYDYKTYY